MPFLIEVKDGGWSGQLELVTSMRRMNDSLLLLLNFVLQWRHRGRDEGCSQLDIMVSSMRIEILETRNLVDERLVGLVVLLRVWGPAGHDGLAVGVIARVGVCEIWVRSEESVGQVFVDEGRVFERAGVGGSGEEVEGGRVHGEEGT